MAGVSAGSPSPLSHEEVVSVSTPPGGVLKQVPPPPATLPRFKPFSPLLTGSGMDAKAKISIVRLQLEAKERERQAEHDMKLGIRKLEIEADKQVKLWHLEMEAMGISSRQIAHVFEKPVPVVLTSVNTLALVPAFQESGVRSHHLQVRW